MCIRDRHKRDAERVRVRPRARARAVRAGARARAGRAGGGAAPGRDAARPGGGARGGGGGDGGAQGARALVKKGAETVSRFFMVHARSTLHPPTRRINGIAFAATRPDRVSRVSSFVTSHARRLFASLFADFRTFSVYQKFGSIREESTSEAAAHAPRPPRRASRRTR